MRVDGTGQHQIATKSRFFRSYVRIIYPSWQIWLELTCDGDIELDSHHTVEDMAICLGRAFSESLADRKGIYRYGQMDLPMDEALVICAIDISGRGMRIC